jgi:glycosyltransferase involved in cell wall biosynthesis
VGWPESIKNQPLLARAFLQLVQSQPPGADLLRLAILGAGAPDCFVLPFQLSGTSCNLKEAMASGLPLHSTAVDGNSQVLAHHGQRGLLVPSGDVPALVKPYRFMAWPPG